MKPILKKLASILVLIILLTSNLADAQIPSGKKIKLLIMVNTRNPLYVAYQGLGDVIAGRILSIAAYSAMGMFVSSSYPEDFTENKTFQETVGNFHRHPFFKDSLINCFKPVSDYFAIDVGEDHAAFSVRHWDQLTNPLFKPYNFVLFVDELNAGLLTTEVSTLSTCTRVSYELYDIKSNEKLDNGYFTVAHTNKRSKQNAINDREAFVNEYPQVIGILCKRIYEILLWRGKLHTMAQTQGLGAFVPTYERYYKLFKRNYTLKVSSPKGWDVGRFAGSQSKFVNPRDRFEASKYVHGRVDVYKLIKDMKEEIDLDKYVESYITTKIALGFKKEEAEAVDLTLQPGEIQFVLTNNGVKYLHIFKKYKGIYAVDFQFEISQDFDRYVKQFKNDITTIMENTKVKN